MGEKRRGRQREKKESISGVDTIAAGTPEESHDRPENTHFLFRCTSKNMHKNESKSLSFYFLPFVCLPELILSHSNQVTSHRAVFLLGRGHSALFVGALSVFFSSEEAANLAEPDRFYQGGQSQALTSNPQPLLSWLFLTPFFFLNCQRLAPVLAPSTSGLLRDGERKGRGEENVRKSNKICVWLKLLSCIFFYLFLSEILMIFSLFKKKRCTFQSVNTGSSRERWANHRSGLMMQNLSSSAPSWPQWHWHFLWQNSRFSK